MGICRSPQNPVLLPKWDAGRLALRPLIHRRPVNRGDLAAHEVHTPSTARRGEWHRTGPSTKRRRLAARKPLSLEIKLRRALPSLVTHGSHPFRHLVRPLFEELHHSCSGSAGSDFHSKRLLHYVEARPQSESTQLPSQRRAVVGFGPAGPRAEHAVVSGKPAASLAPLQEKLSCHHLPRILKPRGPPPTRDNDKSPPRCLSLPDIRSSAFSQNPACAPPPQDSRCSRQTLLR